MADKKFKQELQQPDDFETFVQNIYEAIKDRKREVLGGILIFFLIVGGGLAYQFRQGSVNDKASDAFSQLMGSWPINFQPAPRKDGEEPVNRETEEGWKAFDSSVSLFLQKHGSSSMAPMARIYQGRAKLALGQFDEALKIYRSSDVAGNPTLEILAGEGEGFALLSMEKWLEAQAVFQKLIETPDNPLLDSHRWYLALTYDELGNLEKAKEIYLQIASLTSRSPFSEKAKLRLSMLAQSKKDS